MTDELMNAAGRGIVVRPGPGNDAAALESATGRPLATAEADGEGNWEIYRVGVGDADAWTVEGDPAAAGVALMRAAVSVLAIRAGYAAEGER